MPFKETKEGQTHSYGDGGKEHPLPYDKEEVSWDAIHKGMDKVLKEAAEKYTIEGAKQQMVLNGWDEQSANEVLPYLEQAYAVGLVKGREEIGKPLREALRMLEDEIPFTGEEVIAKIKEALK